MQLKFLHVGLQEKMEEGSSIKDTKKRKRVDGGHEPSDPRIQRPLTVTFKMT